VAPLYDPWHPMSAAQFYSVRLDENILLAAHARFPDGPYPSSHTQGAVARGWAKRNPGEHRSTVSAARICCWQQSRISRSLSSGGASRRPVGSIRA